MKKIIVAILAAAMVLSMAGCSGEVKEPNENVIGDVTIDYCLGLTDDGFYKDIVIKDVVTLPEGYQNVTVPREVTAVAEEDIEGFIENLKETYGTQVDLENKAAEMGDHVIINFVGTVDGVEFQGGKGTDHALLLGSGEFIDTFEEQIVGHNVGEQFDVKVTFPENYGDSKDNDGNTITLSNKEAVFSVTLKGIYQMRLTDANIVEIFGENELTPDGEVVKTVEEAKQYFVEWQKVDKIEQYMTDYLVENSEVDKTVLDTVVANRKIVEKQIIAATAKANGFSTVEAFLALFGANDVDTYLNTYNESLEYSAKYCLIMQAIAEELDIEITNEYIAELYGTEAQKALEEYGQGYVYQQAMPIKIMKALQKTVVVK